MTTKPDDIPQWAWDCVEGLPLHGDSYCDDDDLATIARAILKAKNDAYEEAALAAYSMPDYAMMAKGGGFGTDESGVILPGSPYDRGRYDASQAIRNLKHETEV